MEEAGTLRPRHRRPSGRGWHRGAEIYRAFRQNNVPAKKPKRPHWFEKSPGLVAHYDFKYQNGGVVHRYKDIPRLLDEAGDGQTICCLQAGTTTDSTTDS